MEKVGFGRCKMSGRYGFQNLFNTLWTTYSVSHMKFKFAIRLKEVLVHVGNIHLRLEESLEDEPGRCNALGFVLQELFIETVETKQVHTLKQLQLNHLGLYVDSSAPRYSTQHSPTLVKEQQHIWLLDPIWFTLLLTLSNYLPNERKTLYAPTIDLQCVVKDVKLRLNMVYLSALGSIIDACLRYGNELSSRVDQIESANSSDLMSKREFHTLTIRYQELFMLSQDDSQLSELEDKLRVADLQHIWDEALQKNQINDPKPQTTITEMSVLVDPRVKACIALSSFRVDFTLDAQAEHCLTLLMRQTKLSITDTGAADTPDFKPPPIDKMHVRILLCECRAAKDVHVVLKQGGDVFKAYCMSNTISVFNHTFIISSNDPFVIELHQWSKLICSSEPKECNTLQLNRTQWAEMNNGDRCLIQVSPPCKQLRLFSPRVYPRRSFVVLCGIQALQLTDETDCAVLAVDDTTVSCIALHESLLNAIPEVEVESSVDQVRMHFEREKIDFLTNMYAQSVRQQKDATHDHTAQQYTMVKECSAKINFVLLVSQIDAKAAQSLLRITQLSTLIQVRMMYCIVDALIESSD